MKDEVRILEIPIVGMDCASCARHVRQALASVPGVESAEVLLASERAILELEPGASVARNVLREAVERAGYRTGPSFEGVHSGEPGALGASTDPSRTSAILPQLARRVILAFGLVVGGVLVIAVAGEWLGYLEAVNEGVPFVAGLALAALIGYPVIWKVVRAAARGQITAHALMVTGALAALAVGQWVTAAIVLFFARVGDFVETLTADRARESFRALHAMSPLRARLLTKDGERDVPVEDVRQGELILVRPGEKIPVDGEVIRGGAWVDHSSVTGEPEPVYAGAGSRVFAAGIASGGALEVRALKPVSDSVFGRVVKLVEQAEANRGPVQRVADRFSGYYLPVVAGIAALTYVFGHDLMASISVMVVACSCAFALATPVALLATIGWSATQGMLVKGGSFLEALDRVDVVLFDKTGTLTLGRPEVTNVVPLDGISEEHLISIAASAERYSEHPLSSAIRRHAKRLRVEVSDPLEFRSIPGSGIEATVEGQRVRVGRPGWFGTTSWETEGGGTVVEVEVDGATAGSIVARDVIRPDVPAAIGDLRRAGVGEMVLLTGDSSSAAAALARELNLDYRAELLPEDKIRIVREYQSQGKTVVMIGDGVNDAPALAQADVGIAMGVSGTDVAIEAAHIVLMRDDWRLVPEVFDAARRTMRVVRMNIGFTAAYNLVGISLAAFGMLAPVVAAALQSVPDVGIMANSARLFARSGRRKAGLDQGV